MILLVFPLECAGRLFRLEGYRGGLDSVPDVEVPLFLLELLQNLATKVR